MSEVKESLYSLVQQANVISRMLAESGGELTPELEALMAHVDVKMPEKIDGYKVVMDRLDLETAFWKAKADTYAKMARAHSNVQSRMKEAIKQAMQTLGVDEIKGNEVRFKLSNVKPSLEITGSLDPAYTMTVTETVPDKERIRADLEKGIQVTGAALVPSVSLRPYLNKKEK